MSVTTFSVTYEIPVSPERTAFLESEIARISAADPQPEDAESQISRIQIQLEPEKRTVPARQDTHDGLTDWYCTRPECRASIASVIGDSIESDAVCGSCGATVIRQDLPMSLDLYRMRTRRNDGVEVK